MLLPHTHIQKTVLDRGVVAKAASDGQMAAHGICKWLGKTCNQRLDAVSGTGYPDDISADTNSNTNYSNNASEDDNEYTSDANIR